MNSYTEENYLKAIYHLSVLNNEDVSTNAISDVLKTKAASVTDMLKKLADKQLINYVKYQGVSLTKEGKDIALSIVRKHRLWEVFLVEKLEYKWDEVHDIAEELEHINADELIERLDKFLEYPKTDPHGDPIPDKDGKLTKLKFVPLNKLNINETGVISGVNSHMPVFLQYLEKSGLTLGKSIIVKDIIEFDGSVIILNAGVEQTLSREAAKNILIS